MYMLPISSIKRLWADRRPRKHNVTYFQASPVLNRSYPSINRSSQRVGKERGLQRLCLAKEEAGDGRDFFMDVVWSPCMTKNHSSQNSTEFDWSKWSSEGRKSWTFQCSTRKKLHGSNQAMPYSWMVYSSRC